MVCKAVRVTACPTFMGNNTRRCKAVEQQQLPLFMGKEVTRKTKNMQGCRPAAYPTVVGKSNPSKTQAVELYSIRKLEHA